MNIEEATAVAVKMHGRTIKGIECGFPDGELGNVLHISFDDGSGVSITSDSNLKIKEGFPYPKGETTVSYTATREDLNEPPDMMTPTGRIDRLPYDDEDNEP